MRKLILVIFMISCASSADWIPETVKDEHWNWCRLDLDGPDYADKGWCYSYRACRKKFLGKKECQVFRKYCAPGDIDCLKRNRLTEKWLVDDHY